MSKWVRDHWREDWAVPRYLPQALEPYASALTIVSAVPDQARREWHPFGFPDAPRLPFSEQHYHPATLGGHAGVTWNGVLPVYPCARLDLSSASIPRSVAEALRTHASAHLGPDDALYTYGLSHRSQHKCREQALEQLAALVAGSA